MKKKLVSLLICFAMFLSFVPCVHADNASGEVNSTVNWELNNGTLKITGYGEMTNENASYGWRKFSDQIVNVEISDGITRIGRSAFWSCDRLTNINFPSTLEVIENYVFYGCYGLKSIKFPDGLKAIGEKVFEACYYLENIDIPDSVVYIGRDSFGDTPWYKNQPDGLVYAGRVLYEYKGSIPENTEIVIRQGTKGIADSSVEGIFNKNVVSIILPDTLEYIGESAFENTSIESITLPDTVYYIGKSAFLLCEKLKNIKLPKNISIIPRSIFQGCRKLETVTIPNSVKTIESGAFWSSGITSIIIPDSVEEIGSYAFCDSNLKNVIIGKGINKIGENAFGARNLNGCSYTGSEYEWNAIDIKKEGNGRLYPVNFLDLPYDAQMVSVLINNNIIAFDYPAIVVNGRTLVPLRGIFEAIGATVDWDNNTQTATGKLDSTTVSISIGSKVLYKNGVPVELDVPAQLISGYTMVPVRAVAEAFDADVEWDGDSNTVYVTTMGNNYSVKSVPHIICDGYNANFANFNGMYIDSFEYSDNGDGTENVTFDVYNTSYIYGVVEIYDANGDLKDAAIINKMSNPASIKGVLIDDTGSLIKDIWNGTMLTYKQESGYSKKTSINIDIPKGGFIKITNDMNESLIGTIINFSDAMFGAKKVFKALDGFNPEASKAYAEELTVKLVKEAAFPALLNNSQGYNEKLWEGCAKKIYMNGESLGNFFDTISQNMDNLMGEEFTDLMLDTAKSCGISVAESTFETLAGPAGLALKGMFNFTSLTDELIEISDIFQCQFGGAITISSTH